MNLAKKRTLWNMGTIKMYIDTWLHMGYVTVEFQPLYVA